MTTRMQRVGGAIQKYPVVYNAASLALQAQGRARRPRQIERYLHWSYRVYRDFDGLQIGVGSHTDPKWLCTDLVPISPKVVYMDATKTFPLPDQSFDYVVAEHVIEHMTYYGGLKMLHESYRVLRPNGVLRISTPNLWVFTSMFGQLERDAQHYVEWSNAVFGTDRLPEPAVFVFNRMMREWGHTFLYTSRLLTHMLNMIGFNVRGHYAPGKSDHAALTGIDRHGLEIPAFANEFESMIFEATK